jgi:hypothetical protein
MTNLQEQVKTPLKKHSVTKNCNDLSLWHYRLWSFKTKLERFLHKNQHTQKKLLNFENWTNGEPQ